MNYNVILLITLHAVDNIKCSSVDLETGQAIIITILILVIATIKRLTTRRHVATTEVIDQHVIQS